MNDRWEVNKKATLNLGGFLKVLLLMQAIAVRSLQV